MRRLALFALIAAAVAVVVRALRRNDFEAIEEGGGEPLVWYRGAYGRFRSA